MLLTAMEGMWALILRITYATNTKGYRKQLTYI